MSLFLLCCGLVVVKGKKANTVDKELISGTVAFSSAARNASSLFPHLFCCIFVCNYHLQMFPSCDISVEISNLLYTLIVLIHILVRMRHIKFHKARK